MGVHCRKDWIFRLDSFWSVSQANTDSNN